MSDAEERRRKRQATWTAKVFRGEDALSALDEDAADEWAAMDPLARLALTWELSLDQYGGEHADEVEPRLPRSAYRVERR